jgi:hypothetical protein
MTHPGAYAYVVQSVWLDNLLTAAPYLVQSRLLGLAVADRGLSPDTPMTLDEALYLQLKPDADEVEALKLGWKKFKQASAKKAKQ